MLYRPRLGPRGAKNYHFVKKVLSVTTLSYLYVLCITSHHIKQSRINLSDYNLLGKIIKVVNQTLQSG